MDHIWILKLYYKKLSFIYMGVKIIQIQVNDFISLDNQFIHSEILQLNFIF